MFFPRLRRQAKWVFVFLALVFGVGFVAFGVGSSLPSGFADILGNQSSGGETSVGDAQQKVEENPRDADAQLELSRALQREGRIDEAVKPLNQYVKLLPKDANALQELAGLYTTQANRARQEAFVAQTELQETAGISIFQDSQELSNFFSPGQLDQVLQDDANKRLQNAMTKSSTAFANATGAYEKLVKLEPTDPDLWYLLALTAQSANKNDVAIRGYKQFLKLSPDTPEAAAIRQQIKALQQSQGPGIVQPGSTTRITR